MVEGAATNTQQVQSTALQDLTGKIELIDDSIILNEEFKKSVAIPYFKDIYKDLAAQSDAKSKGINKVSVLNVSTLSFLHCRSPSVQTRSSHSTPTPSLRPAATAHRPPRVDHAALFVDFTLGDAAVKCARARL